MNRHIVVVKGKYVEIDNMYNMKTIGDKKIIDNMISPVRCNMCGEVYDLTDTKVVHRYADCTLYNTPCCKQKADDREWKPIPDFVRLDKHLIKS